MAGSDEKSCISCMQEEEDDVDMHLGTYLSRLSVENFDGEVEDESFSDHTKQATRLAVKECVSESEVHNKDSKRKRRWRKRRRGVVCNNKEKEMEMEMESESESVSSELVVITRPKGGKRSLCMDMEEVKACRELGFELEHQQMVEMPHCNRLSMSVSLSDTATVSSGPNSPNCRISSPGDDPRDVKARLKVWAQAVALASSASRHPVSN